MTGKNLSNTSTLRRRMMLAWMVVWLTAVSCNFPMLPHESAADQAARETLEAYILATRTAVPVMPTLPTSSGGVLPTGDAQDQVSPEQTPGFIAYVTQSGDTPFALAARFDAPLEMITSTLQAPAQTLLPVGQVLYLPLLEEDTPFRGKILPDTEIIYSPTTVGFSTEEFVRSAGGWLSDYTERVDDEVLTGAQIIERVAKATSINPRVLLAVLEYRSGWVFGRPAPGTTPTLYPIGFYVDRYSGLEREITLVARFLAVGYYGWRDGTTLELEFAKGTKARIDPTLNAGTVAVQVLMSKMYNAESLSAALYDGQGFGAQYAGWMGDAWGREAAFGAILPGYLDAPVLDLPFAPGEQWSFTGGPHIAWGIGSPLGAVDFAPSDESGCRASQRWATAAAAGKVARTGLGVVLLDLDGDGYEQTGWVLLYLHMAEEGRVESGAEVQSGDPIGHPSCEGGVATGKHVHLARKYNGEWIGVNGPVPFVLSGWQVIAADKPYHGSLLKGGDVITSRLDKASTSLIKR